MTPPDRLDEAFTDHFRAVTPTDWPGPPSEPLAASCHGAKPRAAYAALALAAAVLLGLSALISRPAGQPAKPDPLLKQAEANGAALPTPPATP